MKTNLDKAIRICAEDMPTQIYDKIFKIGPNYKDCLSEHHLLTEINQHRFEFRNKLTMCHGPSVQLVCFHCFCVQCFCVSSP